jgi:hypothetical protein
MKVIETLRLLLRRPTKADAIVLSNLWRNELVRAFLGGILSDENIGKKIIALQSHWDKHQFGLCDYVPFYFGYRSPMLLKISNHQSQNEIIEPIQKSSTIFMLKTEISGRIKFYL